MKQKRDIGKISIYDIFDYDSINPKYLFVHLFRDFPQIKSLQGVDLAKAGRYLKQRYAAHLQNHLTKNEYFPKKKKMELNEEIFVLKNGMVVQLEDASVWVYHTASCESQAQQLLEEIGQWKARAKRKPFEIHILTNRNGDLELKCMEVKKTSMDLDLFYDDALLETDTWIQKQLNTKNNKGIVLLHGEPGTGKTSYLRYLIGRLKKKVIFLSPDMAESLASPQFTKLLIENSNSVLIIEDAENVITDRALSRQNSVSGLLNLSDGLMSDFLNIQVICTFNKSLTMVDDALMRKGRLIARYEFGRLAVEKAQRLSDHLGFDRIIEEPMTLAEIANPNGPKSKVMNRMIGFRSTDY